MASVREWCLTGRRGLTAEEVVYESWTWEAALVAELYCMHVCCMPVQDVHLMLNDSSHGWSYLLIQRMSGSRAPQAGTCMSPMHIPKQFDIMSKADARRL